MKRFCFYFFCLAVFQLNAQSSHQDCVLWYDQSAKNWNEALPVGNGRLGEMVFGDYKRETIQLNEESLWAGTKEEADRDAANHLPEIQKLLVEGKVKEAVELSERYLKSSPLRIRSYQSFGDIRMDITNENKERVENYRRELDLETGITSVSYQMGDVSYKRDKLTYGATMDIQILNELFKACLDAGKVIDSDPAFNRQLASALKRLPPLQIGKRYNTIQEWIEDYEELEPGHRHMSHLFGLYPGRTINYKQKELFDAARRTIERRRYYNENESNRQGTYTGWSRAWMINFMPA